jgi:hypothetical protein
MSIRNMPSATPRVNSKINADPSGRGVNPPKLSNGHDAESAISPLHQAALASTSEPMPWPHG